VATGWSRRYGGTQNHQGSESREKRQTDGSNNIDIEDSDDIIDQRFNKGALGSSQAQNDLMRAEAAAAARKVQEKTQAMVVSMLDRVRRQSSVPRKYSKIL
jgi:hypothetical protein